MLDTTIIKYTIEALSARGAYPTFSWFLAIAVNVKDLFVKYSTIFIFI